MSEVAGRTGTGAAPVHLPDDSIAEILLRLPATSVLRAGAVCKAWRHITADPRFLAARSRLCPPEVVLYTYLTPAPSEDRWAGHAVDVGLDALPVSSHEAARRRLIRYPKTRAWLLLVSSDGVLLFKKDEGFYLLCNPATRQWAALPRLAWHFSDGRDREYAFYFHQPSGECRLLCRRSLSANGTWCILSTGAAEPRHIDMQAEAAGITQLLPSLRTAVSTPVALHGRLHWPPRQGSAIGQTEVVAFDMLSESFYRMAGPPTTTSALVKLFDMDGLLAAADFGKEKHIDIWFLEDYSAGRWECRHQVATPWGASDNDGGRHPPNLLSVTAAGDGEGNIMLGNYLGLVVYNVRRKTVRAIDSVATSDNNVLVSRHVFRENLVQHPCFAAQSSADLRWIQF